MKQETAELLTKAERAIHNAENTMGEKDMYFSKHGGVHGAFAQHFVKTGEFDPKYQRWLVTTFSQRIIGDYGATSDFILEDVQEIIEQAREFLAAAQSYLRSK